jgi:hypothetical protein
MGTGSDSKLSPPRGHTIAFRLTAVERERIDDLARGEGITTSEFARRAVFGGLDVSASAMEEATELGRDEMRPEIGRLEEHLSRTQTLLAKSRASQHDLYERLTQAPDELTAAAQQLVVGTPGCQVTLATCWSRMDRHDRCKALPIIATIVAADVDRVVRTLRVKDADDDRVSELLDRLDWLMDALTLESGGPSALAGRTRRPEWAPLEASVRRAAEWLLRCRTVMNHRETEVLATDGGETSTSEADEAIGAEGDGAIATMLREVVANEVRAALATVRETVATDFREAMLFEADRTRAAEHLATMVVELSKTIATEADPTRSTDMRATAAPEIDAAVAAEVHTTAAKVPQAGGVALPTLAKLGITDEPAVVRRVPLGVMTSRAPLAGSAPGYLDVAGRHHDWPKKP